MSETSPNLTLPFIQPAQAQKHVTHNEAIEILDLVTQLVLQGVAIAPPTSPLEGQIWSVGSSAVGAWAGQDGTLAAFSGGGWLFLTPVTGWRAYDQSNGTLSVYNGSDWSTLDTEFDQLGINATADATNRLSVAADASLFNHDGAGHQIKLNKSSASDTASLLYQTGFSGRAEMGLTGTDDFAIKVSADGATWLTSLSVAGATGAVTVPQLLNIAPGAAPASPSTGDIYFDDTSAKLRCFDGTLWQDLF